MRSYKALNLLAVLGLVSLGWAKAGWCADFRIALVLDKGGKDDKSFNAAAFRGASDAKEKVGIQLKVVEATDDNAYESLMRSFAQKEFDLIIGVGVAQAEAVKKVAQAFPARKFAIIDAAVDGSNVRSLLFEEHEGSFLAGAMAAMASKTGKVGFIGGVDIPLIRRFEMGYFAGAKKVNPSIKTVANYIGVTGEAWNNPAKAKELATAQYQGGVDVIFSAAGASNSGVLDAAEEKKKLAIGVDSNQNWMKPGFVLTSMLKRVDVAVFEAIRDAKEGRLQGGTMRFGLKNSGVDLAMDEHNAALMTPAMKQKLEELKSQIISGALRVPDYYAKKR